MEVQLLKSVVLLERLPASHPVKDKVFAEVKKSLAGAAGEQRTVELLERELDLPEKAKIFRGISLPYLDGFVQVDVLVVHPNFICVLEVKNMVGEFHFDTDNFQFHRIVDGRLEGIRNPESQLHRAVKANEKFFGCKVHGTIVLSSRSGKVAVAPKLYPVIALDYLPFHIESMADPSLSLDLQDLEGLLRRSRGQFTGPDLLKKHSLTRDSLEVGVRCLGCGQLKMEWLRLRWRCHRCGNTSANAHEYALQEYAILFGNEISTEFAYTWLGVEDKYVLFRMLKNLTIKTNNRGKRVIIERTDILIAYFKTIYS